MSVWKGVIVLRNYKGYREGSHVCCIGQKKLSLIVTQETWGCDFWENTKPTISFGNTIKKDFLVQWLYGNVACTMS